MSNIRIDTLGCRLNQIESESVARYFLNNSFTVDMAGVTAQTPADDNTYFCIVNTCAVTQKAEQKARRIIRLLLKKFPNAAILVTGCYAQISKEEIQNIDKRICVLGGQMKSRLELVPAILEEKLKTCWTSNSAIEFSKYLTEFVFNSPIEKEGYPENSFKLSTSSFIAHSRASLKIQDGCNNACSYCAIHIARGHSVSLDVQTAIDRVKELEQAGQDEVVLTTVNIAQYRGKYGEQYLNFSKLLRLLLQNSTKINFRISSLYPEIVDDEFCAVIADSRVRPHFHISVQSGSDNILKAMNRVYKADDVITACKKLRAVKNNPFIACDIITGFPGESQQDFAATMDLCNACNFAWVHAFPYSQRPGTPAATMKNKVPQSVSGERAKQLTEWAINQKNNYIQSYVGKELDLILETKKTSSTEKNVYNGMTENFIHCEVETNKTIELNSTVRIKILAPLKERIVKGGEIEAKGEIINIK